MKNGNSQQAQKRTKKKKKMEELNEIRNGEKAMTHGTWTVLYVRIRWYNILGFCLLVDNCLHVKLIYYYCVHF